jgi:hypothetical protein
MSALDDLIAQVQAQTPGLIPDPSTYLNPPIGSGAAIPTPSDIADQLQQQNGNGS